MESPEDLKAVAKALAELLRRYELHITEKGYGSHMDRHAKDHKDVGGCLDRIPTGVGGSAPTGASYVTMAAEAGLTSERRVAAGTGIAITDAGANSTVTVAVDVGIADDKILQVDDATAADNDYAKFTAAGLEGRTYAEVKQDLDLEAADISAAAIAAVEGEATLDLTGAVTVAGASLAVDHLIEKTAAHGVDIDGVTLLDSFAQLTEVAKPANPAANKLRVYAKDDGAGVTKLYGLDSAGTETAYGAGGGTSIWDADLDTGVQVEEAADEDKIRFDTGGVERGVLNVSGFDLETHVAIGTSGVLGVVQILHVAETIIDESLGTYYGQNVDVAYAGYAANLYGLLITARAQQTGGTLSILEGLNFIASHESSLATGQMYGVYGQLSSLAGGTGVITGGTCFFASGTFAGRSPATVYGLRVNANLAPASKNTTIAYGVRIEALAATTTNYGIDIAALAGAGTNIGIRNASNYVATPSAAQTLAAGTAILANAEVVQINMAGDVTSTAAPTIADGVDGQRLTIINTDSTDHYVLSDQGTLANSNLRLVTTTITLHPRDSIQLIYSATIGDWVQIAPFTDVI